MNKYCGMIYLYEGEMASKNEFEKNMNEIPLFVSSSQLNVLPSTPKAMLSQEAISNKV